MNVPLDSFIFDTSKAIMIDAEVIEAEKTIPVKIEIKASPYEEGKGWNITVLVRGNTIQNGEQRQEFSIETLPIEVAIGTFNPNFYRPQTEYCNIKDCLKDGEGQTKIQRIPEGMFCKLKQNRKNLIFSVAHGLKWDYV